MQAMLRTISEQLQNGCDLVLAVIIRTEGAVPRKAGACMLADANGYVCGTVGGGSAEFHALQTAQQVLADRQALRKTFSLTWHGIAGTGSVQGGTVEILFSFLPAHDQALISLCAAADEAFARAEDLWLVHRFDGTMQLSQQQPPADCTDCYTHPICSSSRVFILGGGHVSQELVPVLQHLGFRCIVLEDRPEFADPALFPTAEDIRLVDFFRLSASVTIAPQDYVCIMTRGHAYDTLLQAQILQCEPRYLGVIGSRSKAAATRTALQSQFGFSDRQLDRITTPIGISIDAQTPAELAISIAGQLIQIRAANI